MPLTPIKTTASIQTFPDAQAVGNKLFERLSLVKSPITAKNISAFFGNVLAGTSTSPETTKDTVRDAAFAACAFDGRTSPTNCFADTFFTVMSALSETDKE